jgi:aconitate hydratase
MAHNLVQKILSKHCTSLNPTVGEPIEVSIDQVLLHDIGGPMALLEFEAMNTPRVKVSRAIVFIDHNNIQSGFESMDDQRFLESACKKYGLYLSRAGNGICHQVFLERFSKPGDVLLGVDSHTANAGGAGMFAFSAGGLDVAAALAGFPFALAMPEIVKVELKNALANWVSAKDVILEILRRIGISGGKGKVFEFCGDGLKNLSLTERATIANMSIETGALCSIFPSDEITLDYLRAQQRESEWTELHADEGADYNAELMIDLATIEPLIAAPHSPGNVSPVTEVEGLAVNQVAIGSCTNSSMQDMLKVAEILKGRTIAPELSLVVSPGSRQVLLELMESGALSDMVRAGARILETSCGPCMGIGQVPSSGSLSLRTFNRNFQGRYGVNDAEVYLASPETAAASALAGKLTDPGKLGVLPRVDVPTRLYVDDTLIMKPSEDTQNIDLVRGPDIKSLPEFNPLPESLVAKVHIVLGDNVSTDDILPSGPETTSLRSNIPAISQYIFSHKNPMFYERTGRFENGIIVGGENYGQGSSREHAALAPRYLGVRAVLARSFARVHWANLINFGIIPLLFQRPDQQALFSAEEETFFPRLQQEIREHGSVTVINPKKKETIILKVELSDRERHILLNGGLLPYICSSQT